MTECDTCVKSKWYCENKCPFRPAKYTEFKRCIDCPAWRGRCGLKKQINRIAQDVVCSDFYKLGGK